MKKAVTDISVNNCGPFLPHLFFLLQTNGNTQFQPICQLLSPLFHSAIYAVACCIQSCLCCTIPSAFICGTPSMPANMLTSCACFLARTSATDSPSQEIASLSGKMNQSHSLQWRDRAGLSPASILASANLISIISCGRTHCLFCSQKKYIIFFHETQEVFSQNSILCLSCLLYSYKSFLSFQPLQCISLLLQCFCSIYTSLTCFYNIVLLQY